MDNISRMHKQQSSQYLINEVLNMIVT